MERREVLKIGALGAVAAGGLAIPLSGAAAPSRRARWRTATCRGPYVAKFRRPPVLKPYGYTDDENGRTALYAVTAQQADASIVPGPDDQGLGLQRDGARPDDQRRPAHPRAAPRAQPAAHDAPAVRTPVPHLDPPARVRLAAAVRRLRERPHPRRRGEGVPVPGLPGGADALVPRPRRPPHGAERLHRARRAVPPARRTRARTAAAGRVRRAADHHRRDVRRERSVRRTTTRASRACGATSSW